MFQRRVCTVSCSCAPCVSVSLDSAWCLPDLSPPPALSWAGWAGRSRDRSCLGPTVLGCLRADVALLPGSLQSKSPQTGGSKQEKLVPWQRGGVQGQGVPREGPSCRSQPLGFACSPGGSCLWPCLPTFCLHCHLAPPPFSFMRTRVPGRRAHPEPRVPSSQDSQLIIRAKILFPNKAEFQGSE